MTMPARRLVSGSPRGTRRQQKPPMTEPRADGPTRTNRPPTALTNTPETTRNTEFAPRVVFDNYKASYLRM
jgi:hypothetical protein